MKHIGALALLVFVLCGSVPAIAQDAANLPLVGVLRINTPETAEPGTTLLKNALAAPGRVGE